MQHRRRGLFARHAVPRGDHRVSKRDIKLQVFASDVDADAIAAARDGVYPDTIASQISAERLARFFVKEDHGYRVSPELRAAVVFTVQDVLADPPFSRLDMISCRNLLIYLGPEAQAKVIALFHFALREGGTLLLGNAETIGSNEDRFKVISKPERLYRHIGRSRPGDVGFQLGHGEAPRGAARNGPGQTAHQNRLAELVQRLVIEAHSPAAVLINRKHEVLFSSGPTERYLRVAPGHPSHDVLAMAPQGPAHQIAFGDPAGDPGGGPVDCHRRARAKQAEPDHRFRYSRKAGREPRVRRCCWCASSMCRCRSPQAGPRRLAQKRRAGRRA